MLARLREGRVESVEDIEKNFGLMVGTRKSSHLADDHVCQQVYHQDVLARLRESRVESVEDIEWLRVMRFYMEGEVSACMLQCFLISAIT